MSARTPIEAVQRERETRHWTIPQWREAYGDAWPSASADVKRAADTAVDGFIAALEAWTYDWEPTRAIIRACKSEAEWALRGYPSVVSGGEQ